MILVKPCRKEEFIETLENSPKEGNGFAKTFKAKANARNLWDSCMGAYSPENLLLGAICVTISKREPKVANIQLLHTFSQHRRRGVGKALVEWAFREVFRKAEYIRVSSEIDAKPFYEKCGFYFWGTQKSGCYLSIAKLEGESNLRFDLEDSIIKKALVGNRRGTLFGEDREEILNGKKGNIQKVVRLGFDLR